VAILGVRVGLTARLGVRTGPAPAVRIPLPTLAPRASVVYLALPPQSRLFGLGSSYAIVEIHSSYASADFIFGL